ncbi:TlpA family protein disulfide reductase [Catenovulum sp. SM1970]|uniref:TlpA family protein disulfide reductase n=1 Tax=Marinifaba aquimaris TaxID=2741323 RepID=UPI001572489D|nr:TlpA disulfide reductase family protein [Marinifaba aquimaris]NTS77422.1 TlpA family protein disulfide reductase [Marinifaba aquimaris]
MNKAKLTIFLVAIASLAVGLLSYQQINQPKGITATGIWQHSFESNHNQMKLADFQGRYLIVDFWATWCKPCVKSLPYYQTLFADYSEEELSFATINIDMERADADAFLAKNALNEMNVFYDNQGLAEKAFSVKGYPTMLIFNEKRELIEHLSGYTQQNKEALKQRLAELRQ